MLCKKIETMNLLKLYLFDFIDSLKNNRKVLDNFDNSCKEIGNSKVFVDNGTAGRHLGLSSVYNRRNLFHQSKHG